MVYTYFTFAKATSLLSHVEVECERCIGMRAESSDVPGLPYLSTPVPPISPPQAERGPLRP